MNVFSAILFVTIAVHATPLHAETGRETQLSADLATTIEGHRDDLIAFRRDLHRHPEISGEESRTAAKVAQRLKQLGFHVTTNIGGHGLSAFLEGGKPGPIAAFRADMDAVLSNAPDPVSFQSERPGIRHICGHDIHTTIGIGIAEAFAANRQDIAGSLLLIFQPAEETATGAEAMLSDGVFDDVPPDAIFAFHTAPYEIGQLGISENRMMAARDRLVITMNSRDDIRSLANHLRERLLALSTVDTPFASQPANSDFLSVELRQPAIENSTTARISGAVSLSTDQARSNFQNSAEKIISELKALHPDVEISLSYEAGSIPGVVNDVALTRIAIKSARTFLGDSAVIRADRIVPAFSEDFGHFQRETPGVMIFLGVSNQQKGYVGYPHTADYVADEDAIMLGAKIMSNIIIDFFSEE